jgi:HEAT repeat protein
MQTTEEIADLIQKLADPDPSERRVAAEALSAADERAIYPLIKALHDDNSGVQDAAMRSLISIGGEVSAYMALPLLREGPLVRNTARIILRQLGQLSVPLLRPLFADKDDDIRTFALDLITEIGWCDFPQEIVKLLETDENQNTRASAARALGVLNYHEGAPALIAALRDNEWVGFSALESLANMREESCADAVQALLSGPSETLRFAAIEALGKIGSDRSRDALIARIPKANDIEKGAIIRSLVQIGVTPSMAEVADLLLDLWTTGDWDDRLIALTGLADLKYKKAIPAILEITGLLEPSEPESEERLNAVREALEKFGCRREFIDVVNDPEAKFRSKVICIEIIAHLRCAEAVPALISVLDGDLREVRRAAVSALAEIGGDASLAVIRRCVEDRDGRVRSAAICDLGRLEDHASFEPLLRHLQVENYHDVLEDNVRTLLRLDEKKFFASSAKLSPAVRELIARSTYDIDILLALANETDVNVRVAALAGLGRSQDERSQKRLSAALADENAEVRKTAVMAMGSSGCCGDDVKKALKDTDMWVRLYAVKALGDSLKPEAAKSIIPLLYDKEVPVVLAAIDALAQLGCGEAVELTALRHHADERVRERAEQIAGQAC